MFLITYDIKITICQNHAHLFGYFSHRRYRCPVKIVVILSGFYEQMILYISLHLLPRCHKVVISSVYFVFPFRPRRICGQKRIKFLDTHVHPTYRRREREFSPILKINTKYRRKVSVNSRGTQLPNLSGNSEMRSSLMRSLSGPRTITGRVYCIVSCCTASYDNTFSSLPVIIRSNVHPAPPRAPSQGARGGLPSR